jgi:hypothetical protein
MELIRRMDPTTTTPADLMAATSELQPLFTYAAGLLHRMSGEDLSDNNPSPELYAASHGWFDAISRSIKLGGPMSNGRMPPCFDAVYPAFRGGTIGTDFRLAPDFRRLLSQVPTA